MALTEIDNYQKFKSFKDAYEYLELGNQVWSDLNGSNQQQNSYTGKIVKIDKGSNISISILRDDKIGGGGYNSSWAINVTVNNWMYIKRFLTDWDN